MRNRRRWNACWLANVGRWSVSILVGLLCITRTPPRTPIVASKWKCTMGQFTVLLFHKSLGLPQTHGQSFIAFTWSRSTTIKPFDECSIRSTQWYSLSVSFDLSNPSNLRKPRSPSRSWADLREDRIEWPWFLSPPRERASFEPRIATLGSDFWTLSSCFCS